MSLDVKKSQMGPVLIEKRTSQWEELMKKFSEAHKEECNLASHQWTGTLIHLYTTVSVDIPRAPRSMKQFPTGSQYEGTWDVLGMSGFGVYTFPNGVIYEGSMEDGMFQGRGELRYPSGAILRGKWRKGTMVERTLVFADGLEYAEHDWDYCKMPDRRFTIEYEEGLQPAGKSYLTADQPTRDIPPGYYDSGEGFYDSRTKMVYSATDMTAILRSPSVREQKWIVENCRYNPDESVGPRPDLYEEWSKAVTNPKSEPQPGARSQESKFIFYKGSMDMDISTTISVMKQPCADDIETSSEDSDHHHHHRY